MTKQPISYEFLLVGLYDKLASLQNELFIIKRSLNRIEKELEIK